MSEDVQFMLGRLEAKLDSVIATLGDHKTHAATLEARISKLEQWRFFVLGGAAVVGVCADFVVKLLLKG